jgi:hypothetical protein
MAVGLGGLITEGLGGDLNQQMANALAGQGAPPNPAPGGPSPGAPAPGQTPSPTYAPDPQNANTIALLLKVHQQDAISNDLNRNIAGIAAGFGTAQQQHDKQAAIAGMPGDDRLAALGQIEKVTGEQTEQNNAARFQAGAAGMASLFPGMTPQQMQTLAASGKLPEMIQSHFQGLITAGQPTDAIKDYNAARQALRNQGMSEADIDARIPPDTLIGAIGGQTPVEKDMRNDIRMWRTAHPQGTDEQMYAEHPGWTTLTGYAAEKAEQTKTAAAAATDKLQSKANLSDVEKTSLPLTTTIDRLLNNIDATTKAIRTPAAFTTGPMGEVAGMAPGVTGIDQNTLDMKNYLTQLQNQLSGEGLKGMRNVRTQREFNTIAGAAGGPLFSPTSDKATIQQALLDLKAKFGLAHANAIAAAGGEVPAEYGDKVDRDYLNPSSPLYNHATIEQPPAPGAKKAADGNWYVPDPKNPGKYLQVNK